MKIRGRGFLQHAWWLNVDSANIVAKLFLLCSLTISEDMMDELSA